MKEKVTDTGRETEIKEKKKERKKFRETETDKKRQSEI